MKKILSIALCLSLIAAGVIVFAACGKQNKQNESEGDTRTAADL